MDLGLSADFLFSTRAMPVISFRIQSKHNADISSAHLYDCVERKNRIAQRLVVSLI